MCAWVRRVGESEWKHARACEYVFSGCVCLCVCVCQYNCVCVEGLLDICVCVCVRARMPAFVCACAHSCTSCACASERVRLCVRACVCLFAPIACGVCVCARMSMRVLCVRTCVPPPSHPTPPPLQSLMMAPLRRINRYVTILRDLTRHAPGSGRPSAAPPAGSRFILLSTPL